MNEQQRIQIGERIKELRNASPQTNRSIADHVGVGERAVAQWIAGGGIAWENAKKVAELFDVDIQWLWSGRKQAPDVMGALNGSEQLNRIEEALKRIEQNQTEFLSQYEALAAQAEVPDGDPGHGRAERRSARTTSSRGKTAKAR